MALYGRADMVKLLIGHPSCDVNAATRNRDTPLSVAATAEVVALLEAAGAERVEREEDDDNW